MVAAMMMPSGHVKGQAWRPPTACPYSAGGYSDGCTGAPPAPANYPSFLSGVGYAVRPPWNVAGVDYGVGITPGTVLTDWQSISITGVSTEGGSHGTQVFCNGAASTVTINGVDFSLHGGASFTNYESNCSNITITNSKFGCVPYDNTANINDPGSSTWVIENNWFNAAGCGLGSNGFQSITSSTNTTFRYNWVQNMPGELLNTYAGSIDYRFNLIDEANILDSTHQNFLQTNGGGNMPSMVVVFNTVKSTTCSPGTQPGAEGFQFYNNATGTVANGSVSNNVMVARGGPCTYNSESFPLMTYMIHGTGAGSATTTVTGTITANQNYFDTTGADGPWYCSSANVTGWSTTINSLFMPTGGTGNPC